LSAAQAKGNHDDYAGLLDWGLRLLLLLALPCAVALVVFAQPLVAVLFHRGAFSERDVAQTVPALMGYGVGLLGLVGVKILAPGFYARQDIRTPVKIAVIVLVAVQAMNLVFVPWLGHSGLALSIGVGALVNAAWLFVGLRMRGLYTPSPGWGGFALRVSLATAALCALLLWANGHVDWLHSSELVRAGLMAAVLAGAALVYFSVLVLCGLRPRQFMRRG
jgi:putative peptidoglycan lipid II flippase